MWPMGLVWEYFTCIETSPVLVKVCKIEAFALMGFDLLAFMGFDLLSSYGLWFIGFSGLWFTRHFEHGGIVVNFWYIFNHYMHHGFFLPKAPITLHHDQHDRTTLCQFLRSWCGRGTIGVFSCHHDVTSLFRRLHCAYASFLLRFHCALTTLETRSSRP